MRNFLLGVILTLAVVFGGGYLYLATGIYNPSAIPDPGKLERSIAHLSLEASVERRAPDQQNPIQATEENLIAGARMYEQFCSDCHGGAKHRVSEFGRTFSPRVPQIINRIPRDPDANLYWTIKNGIKMTGMPYWSHIMSDDDIWKVVTFIKNSDKLPPRAQEEWHKTEHKADHED